MLRRFLPAILTGLAVVVGAILRFGGLGQPSFWLDEILGYDLTTNATAHPWWSWLVGFDREHGSLFYATQLLGRVSKAPELSGRLGPAIFGVATLVLIWLAAQSLEKSSPTIFAAVAILATSPLHVYYSREARPYVLLMLETAALVAALVARWPVWSVGVLLLCAVYTSATAVPLISAVAVASIAAGLSEKDRARRRQDWIVAALAVAACCLSPLIYAGEVKATPGVGAVALTMPFFLQVTRAFSVTALSAQTGTRTAIIILILAVVGAVDLLRRDRRKGAIVLAMTILPVAVSVAALSFFRHWFSVRYISPGLPGYVLLVAAGIAALARLAARHVVSHWRGDARDVEWVVAVIVVFAIGLQTVPVARNEPFQKLDWRLIATTLWTHAHDRDWVITESWSDACLRFYVNRLPKRLRLSQVYPVGVADMIATTAPPVWIVTAGFSTDSTMRDWACRFPIVLASPLESFRLHYAPSLDDFVASRSMVAERRAWAAGGSSVSMLRLAESMPDSAAPYLDQNTAWRNTTTRLSPALWNRDAVTRLLGRLGYDPVTALQRLSSGDANLEDLAEWIATATGCTDNLTFLRRAYEILLQRLPSPQEEQMHLGFLSAGISRVQVVAKIVKTAEFRRSLGLS